VLTRDGVLVTGETPSAGFDAWEVVGAGGSLRAARVPLAGEAGDEAFLGLEDGVPLFAVSEVPSRCADGTQAIDLRGAAAVLPAADAGLLAYANTLLHWHRTNRFCGRCGEETTSRDGGHLRACENGHEHHPRTDPVVIMLVTDGDRALLGRQASWPANRYSALAGFVEPGESLEAAVAREVLEEAGVGVGEVRYLASQPWPFPCSLMLGFEAVYAGGDVDMRDAELEDARWFTRDELLAARDAEGSADAPLLLPPSLAIARRLLDAWL
jgi:NAD+ diphosphatase